MLRYWKHVDGLLRFITGGAERARLEHWGVKPDELDERISEAAASMGGLLERYGRDVSAPDHAMSLEAATLLAGLCDLRKPRRVLDTGSGFSSYVLRRFAEAEPGVEVWSVDDHDGWLEKTREYLRGHGLDDGRTLLWNEFADTEEGSFDLIFHDLGQAREIRLDVLPDVCARLGPDGLLVLDDFHKHAYRSRASRTLADAGFELVPLRHLTLDRFGRYAALARRAA